MRAIRQLDEKLTSSDIRIDSSGRVVVQSARIQKLVFESLRNGGTLRDPRTLGRLVARTGGRLGTYTIPADVPEDSPPDKTAKAKDSDSEDSPQKPPPIYGEASVHEANFMCRDREDGTLNEICGSWDEILDDETDCNAFCGWGSS